MDFTKYMIQMEPAEEGIFSKRPAPQTNQKYKHTKMENAMMKVTRVSVHGKLGMITGLVTEGQFKPGFAFTYNGGKPIQIITVNDRKSMKTIGGYFTLLVVAIPTTGAKTDLPSIPGITPGAVLIQQNRVEYTDDE